MRRVWAAVVSVWAVLAIVGVLAWSHRPAPASVRQASPTLVLVQGKNGTKRLVVVQAAAPSHATTRTSPAAGR